MFSFAKPVKAANCPIAPKSPADSPHNRPVRRFCFTRKGYTIPKQATATGVYKRTAGIWIKQIKTAPKQ